MADKVEGFLEVGTNEHDEVVINLDRNRTGHVVFSIAQARTLAETMLQCAARAERNASAAERVKLDAPARTPQTYRAWAVPGEAVHLILSPAGESDHAAKLAPHDAYTLGITLLNRAHVAGYRPTSAEASLDCLRAAARMAEVKLAEAIAGQTA